jgi:DNA-directed RNA polymerase subunit L
MDIIESLTEISEISNEDKDIFGVLKLELLQKNRNQQTRYNIQHNDFDENEFLSKNIYNTHILE